MSLDPALPVPKRFKASSVLFLRPTSKAYAFAGRSSAFRSATATELHNGEGVCTHESHGGERGWMGLPLLIDAQDDAGPGQTAEAGHTLSWWIASVPTLPPEQRNGWVLSVIMEMFMRKQLFADACKIDTFEIRMVEAGMQSVLDSTVAPRKTCAAFKPAGEGKVALADESAQRLMLQAIDKSIPTYMSGIRCWAAFCDAMQIQCHFPATQRLVLKYTTMFGSHATMKQYFKHLRWGHRFFHLENTWDPPVVTQALNGLRKSAKPPQRKMALLSKDVASIVAAAVHQRDRHVAALCAIARLFLLRVPSEGIPLEWNGAHSQVELHEDFASITLMSRKNAAFPSTLTPHCCCKSAGRKLCAIHWLHWLRTQSTDGRLFPFPARTFMKRVRGYACGLQMADAQRLGTHAFRHHIAWRIFSCPFEGWRLDFQGFHGLPQGVPGARRGSVTIGHQCFRFRTRG